MARSNTKAEEGQQALAPRDSQLPVPMADLTGDAGHGMEEATQEDLAVPFLAIIQSNSPQVTEMGLKPGTIFNNVTGEVVEPGADLIVVPCHFRREVVEWRLREKGGGFVGVHSPEEAKPLLAECKRDEKNRDIRPNGETHLVVTANHYVLLEDGQYAIIAMSSTQLKKSRKWNAVMAMKTMEGPDGRSFHPPTFAYRYALRTKPESNEKGKWFGWQIDPAGLTPDRDTYERAKAFHQLASQGRVRGIETPEPESDAA